MLSETLSGPKFTSSDRTRQQIHSAPLKIPRIQFLRSCFSGLFMRWAFEQLLTHQ